MNSTVNHRNYYKRMKEQNQLKGKVPYALLHLKQVAGSDESRLECIKVFCEFLQEVLTKWNYARNEWHSLAGSKGASLWDIRFPYIDGETLRETEERAKPHMAQMYEALECISASEQKKKTFRDLWESQVEFALVIGEIKRHLTTTEQHVLLEKVQGIDASLITAKEAVIA